MSSVLVLGGGVGGVVAATELRRRLGRDHRVVLVDKEAKHVFQPSFLWLMVGRRRPQQLGRDLDRLRRRGVEVLRATVQSMDLDRREVTTDQGVLAFDYLVVSLGAELAPGTIPGLAKAGETFYTLEGAERLRDKLNGFPGGRVVILVAGTPFKCPAAPYEAALLVESFLRRRGLRDRVEIDVYTPEKLPMPVAGPDVGRGLLAMLEARGIRFHPEQRVKEVMPDKRLLVFEGGSEAAFDLLAYVPPHRPPGAVRDSGLLAGSGWAPVDPGTLATKFRGVYVIGDLAAIKLPSGLMLPKAGVFAHAQGQVVAHNIAQEIGGGTSTRAFDGHGHCWVEAGDGRAAFGSGDFYASPAAKVVLKGPTRYRHWGKVMFEKYWLSKWF